MHVWSIRIKSRSHRKRPLLTLLTSRDASRTEVVMNRLGSRSSLIGIHPSLIHPMLMEASRGNIPFACRSLRTSVILLLHAVAERTRVRCLRGTDQWTQGRRREGCQLHQSNRRRQRRRRQRRRQQRRRKRRGGRRTARDEDIPAGSRKRQLDEKSPRKRNVGPQPIQQKTEGFSAEGLSRSADKVPRLPPDRPTDRPSDQPTPLRPNAAAAAAAAPVPLARLDLDS